MKKTMKWKKDKVHKKDKRGWRWRGWKEVDKDKDEDKEDDEDEKETH